MDLTPVHPLSPAIRFFLENPIVFAVMVVAVPVGISWYWNNKLQLKRNIQGLPLKPLRMVLTDFRNIAFKEDIYPFFQRPEKFASNPKVQKFTWKIWAKVLLAFTIFHIVVPFSAIFHPLWGYPALSVVIVFLWYRLAKHVQGVVAYRDRTVGQMFEVASSEMKYMRGVELSPWSWVRVQEWENLYFPMETHIAYDTKYRSEVVANQKKFETAFNAVVTDQNIWVYEWEPANNRVIAKPVPNLPDNAPYPFPDGKQWDEVPLGVGLGGKEILWNLTSFPHALIAGTTGSGKALTLDTLIPTVEGWLPMGEIEVGSVLFDENCVPCRVTGISEVSYGRRVYKVVFSDGSFIKADGTHLWLTETSTPTRFKQNTDELIPLPPSLHEELIAAMQNCDEGEEITVPALYDSISGLAIYPALVETAISMVGHSSEIFVQKSYLPTEKIAPVLTYQKKFLLNAILKHTTFDVSNSVWVWELPQVLSSVKTTEEILNTLTDSDNVPQHKILSPVIFDAPMSVKHGGRLGGFAEDYEYKTIVEIVEVDSEPVKCVMVDSPSRLFLAGESCTPTHNSVTQRTILLHMLQAPSHTWRIVLCDPKRVELSPYGAAENVMRIATELDEMVGAIRDVENEMQNRYRVMKEEGVNHFLSLSSPPPAMLLMVDETYALLAPGNVKSDEGKMEDALRAEATSLIGNIARLGRAAGVHMILATQRPDAKVIPGEIRANLDCRIAQGRMDTTPSQMVLDDVAATTLPPVKGRAIRRAGNEFDEFQAYFVPNEDLEKAIVVCNALALEHIKPEDLLGDENDDIGEMGEGLPVWKKILFFPVFVVRATFNKVFRRNKGDQQSYDFDDFDDFDENVYNENFEGGKENVFGKVKTGMKNSISSIKTGMRNAGKKVMFWKKDDGGDLSEGRWGDESDWYEEGGVNENWEDDFSERDRQRVQGVPNSRPRVGRGAKSYSSESGSHANEEIYGDYDVDEENEYYAREGGGEDYSDEEFEDLLKQLRAESEGSQFENHGEDEDDGYGYDDYADAEGGRGRGRGDDRVANRARTKSELDETFEISDESYDKYENFDGSYTNPDIAEVNGASYPDEEDEYGGNYEGDYEDEDEDEDEDDDFRNFLKKLHEEEYSNNTYKQDVPNVGSATAQDDEVGEVEHDEENDPLMFTVALNLPDLMTLNSLPELTDTIIKYATEDLPLPFSELISTLDKEISLLTKVEEKLTNGEILDDEIKPSNAPLAPPIPLSEDDLLGKKRTRQKKAKIPSRMPKRSERTLDPYYESENVPQEKSVADKEVVKKVKKFETPTTTSTTEQSTNGERDNRNVPFFKEDLPYPPQGESVENFTEIDDIEEEDDEYDFFLTDWEVPPLDNESEKNGGKEINWWDI